MIKRLFSYCFIFISFAAISQNAANDSYWISFEEAEQKLTEKPKKTLLYFYTDWCVYCKKMERNAFVNDEVKKLLQDNFYAIKLNAEHTGQIHFDGISFGNSDAKTQRNAVHDIVKIFARRDKAPIAFPAVILLDENFKVIDRRFTYLTTAKLVNFLKQTEGIN